MRSSGAALAVVLIVVAILCASSARIDSATVDEPAHLAAGMIELSHGWLNFYHGQLPLMNSISALPLFLAGYRIPVGWQNGPDEWSVGRHFLYRSGHNAHRLLFLARLPTIVLFLGLCVAVYAFVLQQTGSGWWALAAAALTGFCPNLMAHGRLVTVDLGVTVFAFVATIALLRLIERPSYPTAIMLGVSLAAAVLTKVSALILGPYFLAVIVLALLFRRIGNVRRLLLTLTVGAITALLFFEGFVLAEMSPQIYATTPRLMVPFVHYTEVVRYIRTFYLEANDVLQFRLGNFSRSGWGDYYLVAFLFKTTLPAMLLLIAAVVSGIRRKPFITIALLGFVVMFMIAASAGHIDLGIRYVLPIYPFIYALIAIALADRTRTLVVIVTALVLWHAGENLRTDPSYIAYFNELIGSHRNADRFLVDSNLDWGQDLRRLDQWCRRNGVKQIALHYFGGADYEYEMRSARPLPWLGPFDRLPNGYFAVSRHLYRLSRLIWGVDYERYLESQRAEFVTSIGGSINVYRVPR